ncbi:MAG: hypothetical protein IT204_18930 [Fimbriimonadaceae bacterium]|nr:hypothetical protein [Fimbriimonadaceae bacterium]
MERRRGGRVRVAIPDDELRFEAVRSGGPGGQNVNKRSTRVRLAWRVTASRVLTAEQRALLRQALAPRMVDGEVRIEASDERTQWANRCLAVRRLQELVNEALNPPPPPIPGFVPPKVRAQRQRNMQAAAERRWRERRRGPRRGGSGED